MTLLLCWAIAPGTALEKSTTGAGTGAQLLQRAADDAGKNAFSLNSDTTVSSEGKTVSMSLPDNGNSGRSHDLYGPGWSLQSRLSAGPGTLEGVTGADDPGPQAAAGPDSPGSSRYIVVFDEPARGMLNVAKESVKAYAESNGGRVVHDYSLIDGMTVSVPDDKAAELSALGDVRYVEKDQTAYADLDQAVPQIGANLVWGLGYDGTGVKVCVIDTGIDITHPDLNNGKVAAWIDYVQGRTTAYDDNGHGTHCAGTIAGTGSGSAGQYKGVAPGATLMGAKVLGSSGSGRYSDIIAAINWAVTNHAQVISMSLGGSHSQAVEDAVNSAISGGLVVVVAAGNSGPDAGTISCPGDDPNAITVGAVDRNDVIAYFSSRGPTYNGYIKPDMMAMGVSLVAARAAGTGSAIAGNTYYTAMSGTSMATPMTAGVVALLLDKNASLTPAQVKDALTKTAKPLGYGIPNNDYGYGRVQAKAAIDHVGDGSATPTPAPTPSPAPVSGTAPAVAWSHDYYWTACDLGTSVQATADGGYVATGWTYQHGSRDVYLVKADAAGRLIWNRTFWGTWQDEGNAVRQTADGGYVIAGNTYQYGAGGSSICLIKTDAAGNLEWNRTYNRYFSDRGNAVLQTGDGGYAVAGLTYVGPDDSDVYLIKVNSAGDLQWSQRYGGTGYDEGYALQPTGDGGYVIAGTLSSETNYTTCAYMIRTDSLGNALWNKTYRPGAANDTIARSVRLTGDGGFVAAGTSSFSSDSDAYVLKTDSAGNRLWDRTYNMSAGTPDYGADIRQVSDGGYIVVGGSSPPSGYQSIYLIRTNDTGAPIWQNHLNPGPLTGSLGQSIALTADNGFIICGETSGYTNDRFGSDLILVRANASGAVQWNNVYGERSTDTCTWAQPTGDGGFILTGTTDFRNMGYDMSLVKVDASGREEWRGAYGDNYNDFGGAALQTPDGGYVVAGSTRASVNGYSQAYLIKAGSRGDWVWQNAYGSSSDSWANALCQTSDGGYVLAGGKYDPLNGDCDACLVKTNASGCEGWSYRYGGYADDWANAVTVTPDGGYLFVGGTYSDGTGNCDIYVKKVSSSGTSLWGYYYYTDSSVWGNAVVPTADGGYIITGGVRYNQSETKIVLIKIDGAGIMTWYHYYGDESYQEGMSLHVTVDGGYLVGGTAYDDANRTYRMALMTTNATGYPAWTGTYGQYDNSYGFCARQTGDGGYVLAGTTFARNNSQATLIRLGEASTPNHKPIEVVPAPPMVDFYETGGITGRVTTYNTTAGVANAYVAVVNASNTSQAYFVGTTNAEGFFQFTGVNNTWDGSMYRARYKTYAYVDVYGEGYSNNFTVEAGSIAWTGVVLASSSPPAPTPLPPYPGHIVEVVPAPPMQGSQYAGSVTGRVTTFNTSPGLANTFVAILNASNTSQAYSVGQTDAQGFFQFTGVNHTFDAAAGTCLPGYKVYANNSLFGEGWSNNFSVESNSNAWASVIINLRPAHVKITLGRGHLTADSNDSVQVQAYVTDALNDAVADNYPITFTINKGTVYACGMGNWSGSTVNATTIGTRGGYANATFGMVPGMSAGNNSTLTAEFTLDSSVNDSVRVIFQPSMVSWIGTVVDSYGNALGSVPVTLHVCGPSGEVYALYNNTSLLPPYAGSYSFDNITVWPNVTCAYASASWTGSDNLTFTGRSNNYTLNQSRTSAGFIVIHITLPVNNRTIIVDQAGMPGVETSINRAIANASDGYTIIVHSGTYHESVNVNKPLTLTGVDTGAGLPFIDGDGNWGIYITTSNARVQNFNVTNTSDGILILGTSGVNVNNNTICNNTISNAFNEYIEVSSSNDNDIVNNVITGYPGYTTECGIQLSSSDNATVRANNISGIQGSGIVILGSNGQIFGNDLHNNNFGISGSGSNNTLSGNFIYDNVYDNALSIGQDNNWNSTGPIKYHYNGAWYDNFTGNYWGDYTGSDNNSDGIGDVPYLANGITDYYPLMSKNVTIVPVVSFNLTLQQGWNLISFPVYNTTLRASDLIDNAGLGIDMVATYNNTTGSYTTYYAGAPAWKNLPLLPDRGYFIHGTRNASLAVDGYPVKTHCVNVYRGWNLIGWSASAGVNASDILQRLTVSMVSRYNNAAKNYQTYYAGAGAAKNFSLTVGGGYFVRSESSAVQQLLVG